MKKQKTRLLVKFLVSAACAGLIFLAMPNLYTEAKQSLPLSKEPYGDIIAPTEDASAIAKLKELVGIGEENKGVLYTARLIISAIAILFIIISAVRILTAGGNEEEITKSTKQLMYSMVGLVLISISGDVIKIFNVESGGMLKSPTEMISSVVYFNKTTKILITFFKYLIGGVAVFQMIASGLHLITMEDPSKLDEDKKKVMYGIIGFILIILSDTIVNKVFYKLDISKYVGTTGVQPGVDPYAGVKEIAGITNFIVSFVGPLAILALIAGAIMYITAGGQDERMNKAKRVIIAAAIGIIVIYGAFAIVSTVISRQFAG